MRVTFGGKSVVGFWELVPMESGYDNSEEKDTYAVIKENKEPAEKLDRTSWWKDEN